MSTLAEVEASINAKAREIFAQEAKEAKQKAKKIPKRNQKPTFVFDPANMIRRFDSSLVTTKVNVVETRSLLQYLEAAVMSDGQFEEAVTQLIDALKEKE